MSVALALGGIALPGALDAADAPARHGQHGQARANATLPAWARPERRVRHDPQAILAAHGLTTPGAASRAPTTLTISSLADAGPGSLRAALADAAPGDVIDLTSAHGRIELQSALVTGADGLVLRGPGADQLTLDAGGHDRVLVSRGALTLSGITLRGGVARPEAATAAYGGCHFHYGPLTLDAVVLEDCVAGGGASVEAGGGAAFVQGPLAMNGSTVRNNRATASISVRGGGIVSYGIELQDSVVSGNLAEQQDLTSETEPALDPFFSAAGGGIWVSAWAPVIPLQPGGAPETIDIVSSRITGNTALAAGGFANDGYGGPTTRLGGSAYAGGASISGQARIKYSAINGNSATGTAAAAGGGITLVNMASPDDAALVKYAEISGNSVLSTLGESRYSLADETRAEGGGMATMGSVVISGSALASNQVESAACAAYSCVARGGGMVGLVAGTTLLASTVSGNVVEKSYFANGYAAAGGMSLDEPTTLTLANSTVSGNQVRGPSAYSGAMDVHDGDISNSTIAFNHADYMGGGVYLLDSGSSAAFTMESTIVANNTDGADTPSDFIASGTPTVTGDHNLVLANVGVDFSDPPLSVDPLLGPLAFNGGVTQTHALLDGSPAIDAGSNSGNLSTDQRGYAREVGSAPDIGAYERDDDRIFTDGFQPRLGG